MFEKNPGLKVILYGALVLLGFGLCWLVKPAPEPDIQWTLGGGLTINGKVVDPEKLKVKFPLPIPFAPDKDKGGKRKPGDLGAGELGPAAGLEIPAEMVVRNRGGSDGSGIPVSASLETVAIKQGVWQLAGFTNFCAERPGGQWPEKVNGQLDAYTKGTVSLTWGESKDGCWRRFVAEEVKQGKLPVLMVCAKLQGYGGNSVAHAVIVTDCSWIIPVGDYVLKYVDCNFPGKQFVTWAAELPDEAQVAILPLPTKQDPCPCGDSCACNPCHCHAAKAISFAPSEDDTATPVVGQRGGSKSPELFGIESLVSILREFKEAIFGTDRQPGLKKDISTGLSEWSSTFKSAAWWTAGIVGAWMGWMGISSHRTADALQRLANKA